MFIFALFSFIYIERSVKKIIGINLKGLKVTIIQVSRYFDKPVMFLKSLFILNLFNVRKFDAGKL